MLAGGCFWFAVTGILHGSVEYPDKYHSFEIAQATSPKTYWVCIVFWAAGGIGFLWGAVVKLRAAMSDA